MIVLRNIGLGFERNRGCLLDKITLMHQKQRVHLPKEECPFFFQIMILYGYKGFHSYQKGTAHTENKLRPKPLLLAHF